MQFSEFIEKRNYEENLILEGFFENTLNKIRNKSAKFVINLFKKSWKELRSEVIKQGYEDDVVKIINKHFGTAYRKITDIPDKMIDSYTSMPTESQINEDFEHLWQVIRQEGFPGISIFPGLQVWFELDKVFSGMNADFKKMAAYGILWLLLVSGKYVVGWKKWKKENPGQYKAERAIGKGGIL